MRVERKIKEIYSYREMIVSMVRRELRGRYKGSVLGFLWNFLNPLLQLVVYTVIFTFIFKQDMDKFYLYNFVGLIPFIFFQTCLTGGCACVLDQGGLVTKVYYPREVLPISYVTSQFVNMLYCFVIVIITYIFSAFISFKPSFHWIMPSASFFLPLLSLPLLFIIQYILCLGIVFFLSAITVYIRDVKQVCGIAGMVLMFASPVMWELTKILNNHHRFGLFILYANPMTGLVEGYHNILYRGEWPNFMWLIAPTCWAIAILIIGVFVFEKCKKRFAEAM